MVLQHWRSPSIHLYRLILQWVAAWRESFYPKVKAYPFKGQKLWVSYYPKLLPLACIKTTFMQKAYHQNEQAVLQCAQLKACLWLSSVCVYMLHYVACVCVLVSVLLYLTTTSESFNCAFARPAVGSNLQPSPTMFEVCDCVHTSSAVLCVQRAMLDQTPDCGDYNCWPHTYSCTHAGYKIFNSKLPSSLFLSCLSSNMESIWQELNILLVGQKHHQRDFPCSLQGHLVLSYKQGNCATWT